MHLGGSPAIHAYAGQFPEIRLKELDREQKPRTGWPSKVPI